MIRIAAIAFFLFAAAVPAWAGDDDTQALVAACGASDLSPEKLDDCLEQVRVAAETGSSPELAALQAKLEQRLVNEAHPQPDTHTDVPATSNDDKRDTGAVGQTVLHPYDPDAAPPSNDGNSGDGH